MKSAKRASVFIAAVALILMILHMVGFGLLIDGATIAFFIIASLSILLFAYRGSQPIWPSHSNQFNVSFVETMRAIDQITSANTSVMNLEGDSVIREEVKRSVRDVRTTSDSTEVFAITRLHITDHLLYAVNKLQKVRGAAPLESFDPTAEQLLRVVAEETRMPWSIRSGLSTLLRLGQEAENGASVDPHAARLLANSALELFVVLDSNIQVPEPVEQEHDEPARVSRYEDRGAAEHRSNENYYRQPADYPHSS